MNHCLFHLGQNHYKNFAERKLRELYADAELKALMRSITALACLPVCEVEKGFDQLVAAINTKIKCGQISKEFVVNLQDYLGYLERTYVRRFDKENKPIDALYPIKVWNCYDLLLNNKPRTDNAHEGWHFRFNMRFPKANMSLSQFILRLQDEEEETWQLAIRHEANPADPLRNPRKKSTEKNEEQLQALVKAFSQVEPMLRDQVTFFRHIQLHLAKFELFVEVEKFVATDEVLFVKEVISGRIVKEISNGKVPSFFKGIEADGNCLYRSLAEAIYGEEDLHAQVRMEMMSFLLENRDKLYARFFTAIGNSSVSVEEYAAHFNQPSNEPARWGTSQQLLLAAKLYDRNIILFQPKEAPHYIEFSVDCFEEEPEIISRANGKIKRVYKSRKVMLKPGVSSVLIRYQSSHFDLGWIGQD